MLNDERRDLGLCVESLILPVGHFLLLNRLHIKLIYSIYGIFQQGKIWDGFICMNNFCNRFIPSFPSTSITLKKQLETAVSSGIV